MPSSRRSSLPRDWTWVSCLLQWQAGFFPLALFEIKKYDSTKSCPTLVIPWTVARQAPLRYSPGKNTRVSRHFLLLGNFPTLDANQGLPHCRQMLYRLSCVGSTIWRTTKFCSTEVVPFYISISSRSALGLSALGFSFSTCSSAHCFPFIWL